MVMGDHAPERFVQFDTLAPVVFEGSATDDTTNIQITNHYGYASLTWNPASIADGDGVTSSNITVTGAEFGDSVSVAAPYSLQGIQASAYVSGANTVNIRLENNTGGAIDLASGDWYVNINKRKQILI